MMRNEADYLNPEVFRPERFIVSEDQKEAELDPVAHVFGFGRRYVSVFILFRQLLV